MKIVKKRIVIISIVILVLLILCISLLNGTTASIINVSILEPSSSAIVSTTDTNMDESIIFNVNMPKGEYFFQSNHILFLDKNNKKIKASELKNGDDIYILKLNWIETDLASNPPEIQNILLVKKLN